MSAIRLGTTADIPHLLELAKAEHQASPWAGLPFDSEVCGNTMQAFITSMGHTCFVSDDGYLFGLVQPIGFSGQRVAMEFAWFAKDGKGLRLLAAFEDWAHRMGAYAVVVHDYSGAYALSPILERRYGYKPFGQALLKHLEI